MNDKSIMPFGKHQGEKLANVPDKYLLWLYETGNIPAELKAYIKDNLDSIKKDHNHE